MRWRGATSWWLAAALSMLCWTQAGCGAGTGECEQGEQRCSELKTRAEVCDASGKFVELERCTSATCTESGG